MFGRIFEILKIEILTNFIHFFLFRIFFFVFVNIGPNASENFKTLLQIAGKHFETCPEVSSQMVLIKLCLGFLKF